jgi:CBS domain-containing protein
MRALPINTQDSPPFLLDLINRMKVKDVMTKNLVTARKDQSLREIQGLMKEKGITGVPITEPEHKRILGLVSMDDIIQALDGGYIDDAAETHMSRGLMVLEDEMPLQFAISYLEKYRYGRFPVLNRDRELVGIITSRDIIVALLVEVNKEVEKLEQKIVNPEPVPGEDIHLEFSTRKFDFENAGKASTEIKKVLMRRGLNPRVIRRIAVASYELEMNQVVHSEGGMLVFRMQGDRAEVLAEDSGPGIANVELALEEGYSTANEWVRSLGFGAGMGLANVKRVSDEFTITSEPGRGTTVKSVIHTAMI